MAWSPGRGEGRYRKWLPMCAPVHLDRPVISAEKEGEEEGMEKEPPSAGGARRLPFSQRLRAENEVRNSVERVSREGAVRPANYGTLESKGNTLLKIVALCLRPLSPGY